MNTTQVFLIVCLLYLIIDIPWIGFVVNKVYQDLVRSIQLEDLSLKFFSAFLTYLLMSFGLTYLTMRTARSGKEAAINGAIFGLVMYGVFDFTNMSIFKKWGFKVSIIDIIWGTFLSATVAFLTFAINEYLGDDFLPIPDVGKYINDLINKIPYPF